MALKQWLRAGLVLALGWVYLGGRALAEPFAEPSGRYTVSFPEGWNVAPDPVPGIMTATPPHAPGRARLLESIKVVAAEFSPGMTLERYVDGSVAAYQTIWTVRERREVTLPAGKAWRLVIVQDLSAKVPEAPHPETRLLKVFLASGNLVYVVTCASAPEAFGRALPTFEAVVQSLRVPPAPEPGTWQPLDTPAFSLDYPAGWQGTQGYFGTAAMLIKHVGPDKAAITVIHEPTIAVEAAIETARTNPPDKGRVLSEHAARLGDRPAHRFVLSDTRELYSHWEDYYVGAGDGHYQVRVAFDGEDRPLPPEVLAEMESILARWRWK